MANYTGYHCWKEYHEHFPEKGWYESSGASGRDCDTWDDVLEYANEVMTEFVNYGYGFLYWEFVNEKEVQFCFTFRNDWRWSAVFIIEMD